MKTDYQQRRKRNWLGLRRNDDSTGNQALLEIEGDHRTCGKEIWRKKRGQQVSGTAGGRWRQQHKT